MFLSFGRRNATLLSVSIYNPTLKNNSSKNTKTNITPISLICHTKAFANLIKIVTDIVSYSILDNTACYQFTYPLTLKPINVRFSIGLSYA